MSLLPAAALNPTERAALASCEAIIERGIETFVEVGGALLEIRDQRLYRATHATHEDYCRERWGMTHRHANRLIEAAQVVGTLGPIGPIPTLESQARELIALKDNPEAMAAAWTQALDASNGTPTARIIRDVVLEVTQEFEAKAADRAAIGELNRKYQPPGFDPKLNAELVRQRGEFARLCRDLASLRDPADFLNDHSEFIRSDRIPTVRDAWQWLSTFLELWENIE